MQSYKQFQISLMQKSVILSLNSGNSVFLFFIKSVIYNIGSHRSLHNASYSNKVFFQMKSHTI